MVAKPEIRWIGFRGLGWIKKSMQHHNFQNLGYLVSCRILLSTVGLGFRVLGVGVGIPPHSNMQALNGVAVKEPKLSYENSKLLTTYPCTKP